MSDLAATWDSISEAELQTTVVEMMEWQGWRCYHTFDSRRSNAGFPDLVAVKGGRLLFVEFKSEKGKVRATQYEWLDALAGTNSAEVYLVRPSGMDTLIKAMGDPVDGLPVHWHNMREGE